MGDLATLWTARFCAACYVLTLAGRGAARQGWWTAAWAFLLLHVLAAFQFEHRWSLAAAYAHTAAQTAASTGWHWGGGLYLNFALVAAWGAHVAASWIAPERIPRAVTAAVHGFAAFMLFNATVVFAAGPTRWAGLAALAGLGFLALQRGSGRFLTGCE